MNVNVTYFTLYCIVLLKITTFYYLDDCICKTVKEGENNRRQPADIEQKPVHLTQGSK